MKLALVGAGKMGGAVLAGAVRAGLLEAADVGVYHPDPGRRAALAARFGATPLDDDGVHRAERVLVAVKPQSFESVAPLIAQRHASYVSLMAGVTTSTLSKRLGSRKVVRAMPNLGAAVGASATALAWHPETPEDDREFARRLFQAVGSVHEVPESLFDAYTGLAGSGPAFAAVVAEGLADGGVRVGLSRDVARDLARQVLLATARLLEGKHTGELKDEVASPGGTAIAGVRALESHRVRFAMMDAIEAATERARALSRDGEDA
ncbi:MAG: pyrroline-5-carboxylate reductase [bacterium]|nr:pyrroline-5-carboxylate reductase [bacterium]